MSGFLIALLLNCLANSVSLFRSRSTAYAEYSLLMIDAWRCSYRGHRRKPLMVIPLGDPSSDSGPLIFNQQRFPIQWSFMADVARSNNAVECPID